MSRDRDVVFARIGEGAKAALPSREFLECRVEVRPTEVGPHAVLSLIHICERTGSFAVLEGSIKPLGSEYVLDLRSVNCRSGENIDDQQAQVARKEDALDAVTRMARGFRARAGESAAALLKHDTPLAEATTPSLEALSLIHI